MSTSISGNWFRRGDSPRARLRLLSSPPLLLGCLACLVVLLAQPIRHNTIVGVWTDDAYYIARAESLARGLGMRQLEVPGAPEDRLAPPGYPLLLAPILTLFPDSLLPLRLTSLVLHVTALYLIYIYSRRWLDTLPSIAVVALYGLHIEPLTMSVQVGSEAAFVCLVMLALLCLDRDADSRARFEVTAWGAILAAIAVKILGIALAGAQLVVAVGRRRWWAAAGAGLILAVAAGWLLRADGLSDDGSATYVEVVRSDSKDPADRLIDNSMQYAWQAIPFMLLPGVGGASTMAVLDRLGLGVLDAMAKVGLLMLVVGGWLLTARGRLTVGHVWLLTHLVLLVSFIKVSPRYLIPVLPLLYIYLLYSLRWLLRALPSSIRAHVSLPATAMLVALFIGSFAYQYWKAVSVPIESRVFDPRIGTVWLRDNVVSTAPVLYNDRRSGFLYTRRPIVPIPSGSEGPPVSSLICDYGVEHVIITPVMEYDMPFRWSVWAEQVLVAQLEQSPDVKLIHQSEAGLARVYEIGRGFCRGQLGNMKQQPAYPIERSVLPKVAGGVGTHT